MYIILYEEKQCVCLLHNSKTIKPSSLKLCMHTKKTLRKCKSENWVFGLIKRPPFEDNLGGAHHKETK